MLTLITLTGPHDFQLICTFFIYLLYLTFLVDFALVFWVFDRMRCKGRKVVGDNVDM